MFNKKKAPETVAMDIPVREPRHNREIDTERIGNLFTVAVLMNRQGDAESLGIAAMALDQARQIGIDQDIQISPFEQIYHFRTTTDSESQAS